MKLFKKKDLETIVEDLGKKTAIVEFQSVLEDLHDKLETVRLTDEDANNWIIMTKVDDEIIYLSLNNITSRKGRINYKKAVWSSCRNVNNAHAFNSYKKARTQLEMKMNRDQNGSWSVANVKVEKKRIVTEISDSIRMIECVLETI